MISILEPVRKPSWSMDIGTSNSKRKLPIRISMFWRWLLWRSSRRFTSRTRWEVKRLVSFIKSTTVPFCPLTVSLGRCLTVTNSGWGNYTLKYLLNDPDQRPSFVFSSHPDLSSISMLRKLDIRQLSCKCFIFSSATQPALLTLKSKLCPWARMQIWTPHPFNLCGNADQSFSMLHTNTLAVWQHAPAQALKINKMSKLRLPWRYVSVCGSIFRLLGWGRGLKLMRRGALNKTLHLLG